MSCFCLLLGSSGSLPYCAVPCHAMPCCTMPFIAVLCCCPATLYHALPCHTGPCCTMICPAVPCHAMPCHAMPCHFLSRRILPCQAVPRHSVLCHTMSRCMMLCPTTPWRAMRRPAMLFHVAAPCRAVPAAPYRATGRVPCSAVSCHASPRLWELPTPLLAEPQGTISPLSRQLHVSQHLPCSRGAKALTPPREGQWSPGASANPQTPRDSTATEQCGAANTPGMRLPLPPLSDRQRVSASPVTPRSNVLLF